MERAKFLLKNRQKEVGRLSEDQVTNSNNKCKMCKTLMTVLYHKQINWFLPLLIMSSKIFNYHKYQKTSKKFWPTPSKSNSIGTYLQYWCKICNKVEIVYLFKVHRCSLSFLNRGSFGKGIGNWWKRGWDVGGSINPIHEDVLP